MMLIRAACLLVLHSLFLRGADSTALWPITLHGKQGYINRLGQIVIPPQYRLAWGFSEGLASLKSDAPDSKAGFIDSSGTFVIPPQFSYARNFREDIAEVEVSGLWGFINKNGAFIASPSFDQTRAFSEGYGAFQSLGKWGFLDAKGGIAIAPEYDCVWSFSESLAAAFKSGKCGFIDKTGAVVIPFTFDDCGTFRSGLAAVKAGRWGYIDRSGQWVVPSQFDFAMPFDEGVAAVAIKKKWALIDSAGQMLWEPKVEYDPLQGFAPVFSQDLACVKQGDAFGFINRSGEFGIPPRFLKCGDFRDGLAWACESERKCGYIDLQGRYVWAGEP